MLLCLLVLHTDKKSLCRRAELEKQGLPRNKDHKNIEAHRTHTDQSYGCGALRGNTPQGKTNKIQK